MLMNMMVNENTKNSNFYFLLDFKNRYNDKMPSCFPSVLFMQCCINFYIQIQPCVPTAQISTGAQSTFNTYWVNEL